MRSWKRIVGLAVVVALSAGAGVAVAEELTSTQPPPTSAADQGAVPPVGAKLLANGFQNEGGFVPITPCRILDTRKGYGKLQVSAPKEIDVRGSETTFTTQGGNPGGCGIPAGATAIEATITAIDSGSGFLRAWPANISQPNATFLNYDSAFNVSNTGTITLCGGQNALPCNANKDLSLQAYGSATDLVIDVNGFYIRKMAAVVNPDGSLADGNRATSLRLSAGTFEVQFDRNVAKCSYSVTPRFSSSKGWAHASPRAGNVNAVFVAVYDDAGALSDHAFSLEVTC